MRDWRRKLSPFSAGPAWRWTLGGNGLLAGCRIWVSRAESPLSIRRSQAECFVFGVTQDGVLLSARGSRETDNSRIN